MAESVVQHPKASIPEDLSNESDDLLKVRSLLFGGDYQQLKELKTQYQDPAEFAQHVAQVLAEAIDIRTHEDNKLELAQALQPNVEYAIQASVKQNPQPLVDALFPVIGPAIRKAISEALNQMMQTLNSLLENSVSSKAIKWRFEAWRSGKSYAEIVMLRSLLYQVEQVFLIHKESGLLLQHEVSDSAIIKDPDMVSAMLTAIQDFISDSFKLDNNDGLHSMRLGDVNVVLEQGPDTVLAVLVRGVTPANIRELMQNSLEKIQYSHAAELQNYNGDSSTFDDVTDIMRTCLISQKRESKPKQKKSKLITVSLLAIPVLALAVWGYFSYQKASHWQSIISTIKQEPGYVIIEASDSGGEYRIRGLREQLARTPQQVLGEKYNFEPAIIWEWQSFISAEKEFVLRRVAEFLEPPARVSLGLREGVLYMTGEANQAWIDQIEKNELVSIGVQGINREELFSSESRQQLVKAIELQNYYFSSGAVKVDNSQVEHSKLLAQSILDLKEMQTILGQPFSVVVTGYADQSGSPEKNRIISEKRAENTTNLLQQWGVPGELLIVRSIDSGQVSAYGKQERKNQRRVSFQVKLNQ